MFIRGNSFNMNIWLVSAHIAFEVSLLIQMLFPFVSSISTLKAYLKKNMDITLIL